MLEAVFSESAAGSLKAALHREDRGCGSPSDIFHSSPEDVFLFADDLSAGDISGDCLSEERQHSVSGMYSPFPDECEHCLKRIQESAEALEELIRRSAAGEAVRIWYSGQPREYCGMCRLISELKKRLRELPPVSSVRLPDMTERGGILISYTGWSSVSPEEFQSFLPLEKEAGPAFIGAAVLRWAVMQQQNACLRAFINGRLQSVPEDFYDYIISKEIGRMDHEFPEDVLIGNIIGRYQPGVGDIWIALRIEKMVESGLLVPVTGREYEDIVYSRVLRKKAY